MTGRRGFSVVETLVVGVVLLVVVQASWWVVAIHSKAALQVVRGAQVMDGSRLVEHLVRTEIAPGVEGVDWIVSAGELHLRAFRGLAVVCGPGSTSDEWIVQASGYRQADPAKDSLLVLGRRSGWEVARLVSRRAGTGGVCPVMDGFVEQAWRLAPPVVEPVMAQFFERGAYRFSSGAFRYRRGLGGWQPLTEGTVSADSSSFEVPENRSLVTRLDWEVPGPVRGSRVWSAWGPS